MKTKAERVTEAEAILDEMKAIEAQLDMGDVIPSDAEMVLVDRYEVLSRVYRRDYLRLMHETI